MTLPVKSRGALLLRQRIESLRAVQLCPPRLNSEERSRLDHLLRSTLPDWEIRGRWSPELAAEVPSGRGGYCLDLGCGSGRARVLVETLGYRWVGVDIVPTSGGALASAHRLPFPDNLFELVISVRVFEHLAFPCLATKEVARVLRRGGKLIGSTAFLEPFHGDSYFHMTHLGLDSLLRNAGFRVERMWPDQYAIQSWVDHMALGFFRGRLRQLTRHSLRLVDEVALSLRTIGRALRNRNPDRERRNAIDRLGFAGGICFIAAKQH